MRSEDDRQAFRERVQAERFVRHLRDVAETRISREDLRSEVGKAFERNGARRDVAAARGAFVDHAARNTPPAS